MTELLECVTFPLAIDTPGLIKKIDPKVERNFNNEKFAHCVSRRCMHYNVRGPTEKMLTYCRTNVGSF